MKKATPFIETEPVASPKDALTEVLRSGAQRMLAAALEAEVALYVTQHADARDEDGHRLVVRNGHCSERTIQTGLGSIEVRRPRVHDRRVDEEGQRIRFTSSILPPYLRRTKSLDELIPWLYLKGISTGGFSEALAALLGTDAPGLSSSTVVRLKQIWETEFKEWSRRDLTGKEYVYIWVDGIHFNIRLEEHRQCILVVMGATADGKKELLAIQDGYRESEQSWKELLLDLKARGLTRDPELAIGDGALGFWKALPQVWPGTRAQRCWCHKSANVLNKLPKREQPRARMRFTRSGWRQPRSTRSRPSTSSRRPTRRSTRRPLRAWSRTGTICWPSTTSPPNTGSTSARPTPSNRPSRRCAYVRSERRARARASHAWRWSSSSLKPQSASGGN